ncbi:thioredoxin fold domain-containing protein [Acidiferrobacter sp.]|uniref:thioredoxin fold domain-containing protein n=1 Tax=Acidiferrobacter sp. TaxID=1872107 RepID=UPI002629F92E|nr:thioredoxin fold domain-containing protein [Acidiferrobacter sp.]
MDRGGWWRVSCALTGLMVFGALPVARASSFGPWSPAHILHNAQRDPYTIREGNGSRQLYVFVDPNCPFCHRLFERLQPLIGPHHVTVHWIVTGFLRATSAGKAAAILGARRPLAALMQSERGFRPGRGGGGGGIGPVAVRGRAARAVAVNTHLLAMTGFELVPTLVYRNTAGRAVMHQGVPLKPHGLLWTLRAIQ